MGGHAILTFDLNNWTKSVEAVFRDVPKFDDLKARVFLELDKATFETSFNSYNEVDPYPICQTYSPSGATPSDRQWVKILKNELNQNVISLPVRPVMFNDLLISFDSLQVLTAIDSYIDPTANISGTEPVPGNSLFSNIDIDITLFGGSGVVDVGFSLLVEADLTIAGTSMPGITMLYNDDGTAAADNSGNNFSLYPNFPYRRLSVALPKIDPLTYKNNGLFIGSTIFNGPPLETGSLYDFVNDTYNLTYGLLYREYIQVGNDFGVLNLSWTLPAGVIPTDLEYKIIHIKDTEVVSGVDALETVAQVKAFKDTLNLDYGSYPSSSLYLASYPAATTGSWVVILARLPNGKEFIFSRGQAGTLG